MADVPAHEAAHHDADHGGDSAIDPAWLATTWFLDHDHPSIAEFVERHTGHLRGDDRDTVRERAVALFHAVRDGYRYDPYRTGHDPADYRASAIVGGGPTWCVPKSVLLTAAARRAGIPARLGFADVRNHLTSAKLSATMGTDLFLWHGYSEMLLDGQWRKVSSAFNRELCERFGTKVLEFDGTADALMHPYDQAGNRHMEYVTSRGSFDDLPLEQIFATFREVYPSLPDDGTSAAGADAAGDDAFR
jgi:transglutaminase-like putative cysteine protease